MKRSALIAALLALALAACGEKPAPTVETPAVEAPVAAPVVETAPAVEAASAAEAASAVEAAPAAQ